ncbi:DUF3616 domain-containing protein [Pseudonocardia sp. H11422]|uniref:DUF3616 domain-containing protein n=1 Tax=Pseudonocardia sp. H11422 TaxID=2835866 RepID=UPI001BDD9E33|nr:DUF3616 domain-containing protein [Pseudonocardia sp. H11422]
MDVVGQIELHFHGDVVRSGNHVNLSAVRLEGDVVWLAGDETATVERLVLDSPTAPARAQAQLSVRLGDLVELPGDPDDEADIEGIARAGGDLWLVGSHSLVRKRIKPGNSEAKALRRLATVRRDPNRFVVVRLAVEPGPDGRPVPVRVAGDGRVSAVLGARGAENLTDVLAGDEHLGPFLSIPGKDNGLDVEGLAVHGDSLYVGLRGPVLRGWAMVLEVRPVGDPDDPGRLRLGAFPDGTRYRKHVLDLRGLGVRDLCPHGDDLLVLAGPTMSLSGPVRVHRWHGAAHTEAHRVVRGDELTLETELPHGDGVDHAEGIALLPGEPPRLLVVYDSPAPARRPTPHTVLADVVALRS